RDHHLADVVQAASQFDAAHGGVVEAHRGGDQRRPAADGAAVVETGEPAVDLVGGALQVGEQVVGGADRAVHRGDHDVLGKRVADHDPVAALELGRVEGPVGGGDQFGRGAAV